MQSDEIVLYKQPRKSTAPTMVNGYEFCTAQEREELYAICKKLSAVGHKLVELTKSAAGGYFQLGEWLYARIMNFPYTTSARDLTKALPDELHLSYETICKALKIYKHFSEYPEFLNNLTLRDCMKLIADGKTAQTKPAVVYEEDEEEQLEFDIDEFFRQPTLSGAPLQNARFASQDNELFVIRKGFDRPERIAVVYETVPDSVPLRTAYNQMMANIQRETEKYFAVVEQQGA